MGALWDALGAVGSALSAPGDYTRGVLAGRPGERATARDLLSAYNLAEPDDDSWLGAARDIGTSFLTDPLTYAGGGIARMAGQGASKVPGLLGLRRNFAIAHGVDDAGQAARVLGGTESQRTLSQMIGQQLAAGAGAAGGAEGAGAFLAAVPAGEVMGQSLPGGAGAILGRSVAAGRHETMHGLIDAAVQSGDTSALGPLAKLAAWGQAGGSKTGLRAGFGNLMHEAAAHAAEGRGLAQQSGNALDFLFGGSPAVRQGYAEGFARTSPIIAAAYRGLGYVPTGMGVGASGMGAYGLGQTMWG